MPFPKAACYIKLKSIYQQLHYHDDKSISCTIFTYLIDGIYRDIIVLAYAAFFAQARLGCEQWMPSILTTSWEQKKNKKSQRIMSAFNTSRTIQAWAFFSPRELKRRKQKTMSKESFNNNIDRDLRSATMNIEHKLHLAKRIDIFAVALSLHSLR